MEIVMMMLMMMVIAVMTIRMTMMMTINVGDDDDDEYKDGGEAAPSCGYDLITAPHTHGAIIDFTNFL